MKKNEVITFINEKSNNSFEWNPLFNACLCEATETVYTKNGEPFTPPCQEFALRFAKHAKSLLEFGFRGLIFRQVSIEDYLNDREQLIAQLDQLIDQCKPES